MSIGVHVLGPGYGECIILQLPENQFGVIDGYRTPVDTPTLPHLLRSSFGVQKLLFLATTHPHADHCLGIPDLIREFEPERLWVYPSVFSDVVVDFYARLFELGERNARERRRFGDPIEQDLLVKEGSTLKAMVHLRDAIATRGRQSNPHPVDLLTSSRQFTLCKGSLTVTCLTPGSGPLRDYGTRVTRAFEVIARSLARRGLAQKVRERVAWLFRAVCGSKLEEEPIPDIDPNRISTALLVTYGNTRILLLADAVEPLWDDWVREQKDDPRLCVGSVHLIKAAHHGSGNGYCASLYSGACLTSQTLIVVTPFTRQRNPLPSRTGADLLSAHQSPVYCTNRFAAAKSSGRTWNAPPAAVNLPAVPTAWVNDLACRRELERLLVPYGQPGPLPDLPPNWRQAISERPELGRLLVPPHGPAPAPGAPASPTHQSMFSVYFDDKGHVERTSFGPQVGVLA